MAVQASKAYVLAVVAPPTPGVSVAKAAALVVTGPQPGVNVAKAAALVVTTALPAAQVSKLVGFAVISPPVGAVVVKLVGYAVVTPCQFVVAARTLTLARGSIGGPSPEIAEGWTPTGAEVVGETVVEDGSTGAHEVTSAEGLPADGVSRVDVDVTALRGEREWVKITIGDQWGFVNLRTGALGDHSDDFVLHGVV